MIENFCVGSGSIHPTVYSISIAGMQLINTFARLFAFGEALQSALGEKPEALITSCCRSNYGKALPCLKSVM